MLKYQPSKPSIPQLILLFSVAFISSVAAQPPTFVDVTEAAGIHFKHSNGKTEHKHIIETMGSGAVFFRLRHGW